MAMEGETLYDILNVSVDATMREIKQSHSRLSRSFHPDKNADGTDDFLKMQNAYETLIVKESRKNYDISIGIQPKLL